MDRMRLYDITYALAAGGGREAVLFGDCGPAAREAFSRSLAGGAFPELWFELPLAGNPWMDFHALVSYGDVAGTEVAFAGHGGAYADALSWFAGQGPGKVRQLALSYDTRAGDVDAPAVQLLVDGPDPSVPLAFLEAAGRPGLRGAYAGFTGAMPPEWYACYVGVFPGRDADGAGPWVRVECIVGESCQQAYAQDAGALHEHLARVGIRDADTLGAWLADGVQALARSPFPLEFQFNVGADGKALPVLSASVRFQPQDWESDEGRAAIGRLAGWLQERGLADRRCALLPQTVFAKRVERGGEAATITCFPAFVKLRWRESLPPDAKAYLLARVAEAAQEARPCERLTRAASRRSARGKRGEAMPSHMKPIEPDASTDTLRDLAFGALLELAAREPPPGLAASWAGLHSGPTRPTPHGSRTTCETLASRPYGGMDPAQSDLLYEIRFGRFGRNDCQLQIL